MFHELCVMTEVLQNSRKGSCVSDPFLVVSDQ